jgi:hypothetical protein
MHSDDTVDGAPASVVADEVLVSCRTNTLRLIETIALTQTTDIVGIKQLIAVVAAFRRLNQKAPDGDEEEVDEERRNIRSITASFALAFRVILNSPRWDEILSIRRVVSSVYRKTVVR